MSVNEFVITPPDKLNYKGSPDTQIHLTVSSDVQRFKTIYGNTRGVPNGGTNGQFLAKQSNADYDICWKNGGGGGDGDLPVGGDPGQVLAKISGDDYDTEWVDVTATAGGNDTEIQYNNAGTLAGNPNFTFNDVDGVVGIGTALKISVPEILPNSPLSVGGDVNSYVQVNLQNINNGGDATADFIITANDGDDESYYADYGICNSGYVSTAWDIFAPHDMYLYDDGGSLVMGTMTPGEDIKFFIAGTAHEAHPADTVMTIDLNGVNLRSGSTYEINGVSIPTNDGVDAIELQNIECHGSGVVTGGTLIPTGGITFAVAPYVVYVSNGTATIARCMKATTTYGLSTLYDGLNVVCINAANEVVILNADPDMTVHVLLGVLYTALGNTLLADVVNTPVYTSKIAERLANFATNAVRALVEEGCSLSEGTTNLTLSAAEGTINVNVNTYTLAATTSFVRMYKTANFGWVGDVVSSCNPTVWNDITKNYGSALITCTATYWTKSLVYRSPGGTMYYVYGQAEYATEEEALAAAIPTVPANVGNVNVFLATIVAQAEDTSIGTRIHDVRPYLPRIFGYGSSSSGVSISHSSLTGLSADDHTQYHNNTRGDARYAPLAKGVTNGDSHDHNGSGDGAQIYYTDLRNRPTLGTAAAQNVGYFAAAAHAHEGTAILSTGETGAGKFLREDGDGTCSWQAATADAWDGDITDVNLDGGTDIGAALADADLILVDDGGAGTNRKCAMSRVKTYIGAATTATKLDDFATPDDNTDLNANTTNHGLLVKATAPASGLVNVVGIANAETAYTNKALFDTTNPAMNGTAAPGTAVIAARRDHVHASDTSREPVISSKGTAFNQNFETSTSNIKMDGSVSVGALSTIPRADHIHASDTSRLVATRGYWKAFYSDGSGAFTELALGANGTVLTSSGASSAPTFTAPPSGGAYGNWKSLYTNGTGVISEAALGAVGTVLKGGGVSAAPSFGAIPGVFNVYNVKDYGATGDSSTDDTTAIRDTITATAGDRGATVFFPSGIYKTTGTITINRNSVTFRGPGAGAATIYPTSTTVPVFQCTAGNEFITFRDLEFFAGATQAAGSSYIDTNGAHDILIDRISMSGAYYGVYIRGASIKVTISNTLINSIVATNGVGIYVDNGLAGDTYLGPWLVMSNDPASKPLAGIYIKESGHFCIHNANITSCDTGLYIYPTATKDIQYGFISESLFDSCGTNAVYLYSPTGAGRIRSLKFTGCWMSGSNPTGVGYGINMAGASTGVMDDINFSTCRILNNGRHGINYNFGSNVRINDCTISGNSQSASNIYSGINVAAAISDFEIIGNRIGTAGTATNTQKYAVHISAGASNNYQIMQNDVGGNNTAPFIGDFGTGIFKRIHCNINAMPISSMPALSAAMQSLSVAANVLTGSVLQIPVNSLMIGTRICWEIALIKTAAGVATFEVQVKFGTTGGTSDTRIAYWTSGTNTAVTDQARLRIVCDILTLGAAATAQCNAFYVNTLTNSTGLGRIAGAPSGTATFDSTASPAYIHIGVTPGSSAVMTSMCETQVIAMG